MFAIKLKKIWYTWEDRGKNTYAIGPVFVTIQ
jgi:hypothetical protein